VVAGAGPERGLYLIEQLAEHAQQLGIVPHL
jgi:pyruvate dehydrogenase E1 component